MSDFEERVKAYKQAAEAGEKDLASIYKEILIDANTLIAKAKVLTENLPDSVGGVKDLKQLIMIAENGFGKVAGGIVKSVAAKEAEEAAVAEEQVA